MKTDTPYQMTKEDWIAAHYVLELFRMICNHGVAKTQKILSDCGRGGEIEKP